MKTPYVAFGAPMNVEGSKMAFTFYLTGNKVKFYGVTHGDTAEECFQYVFDVMDHWVRGEVLEAAGDTESAREAFAMMRTKPMKKAPHEPVPQWEPGSITPEEYENNTWGKKWLKSQS